MAYSGWIECHCGQAVPGYLADSHVMPGGVSCVGIREELHRPTLCYLCLMDDHSPEFLRTLETIRWEKGVTVPGVEVTA
jgi:hypothetical protein